jgi:hypothetical protein
MEMDQAIGCNGELSAVVTHRDGSKTYYGALKPTLGQKARLWLRNWIRFFVPSYARGAAMLIALLALLFLPGVPPVAFGLVTTAGVNYMASDFASGGVTPTISGFKFHDCGTGTTAAAVGDTALQTAAGTARVSGTASNPSANVYQSVATIAFTSTLAITEWGLFSASSAGTLWDHRVFSAINVVNGDSIQFTYKLTVNNGGS